MSKLAKKTSTHPRVSRRHFLQASSAGLGTATLLGTLPAHAWADQIPNQKWLQIVHIKRTTVKVPFRELPAKSMARELPHWQWTEVVEVELKSGQVGFGETLLFYTWSKTSDDDVRRAEGRNAAELMWDDSLGAGLQIAMFDAVARTLGIPVHRLLGKQVHQKTPLAWWNIDMPPQDMAAECQEAYRQGYRSYKTKGRPWFDPWKQVEMVGQAVPTDFGLTIDFNSTLLDAERGIPILLDLKKTPQVAIWENPIPQNDVAGNQAIRRDTTIPLAMHYGNPAPQIAIPEKICDGFLIGGGATLAKRQAAVVAMAKLPLWLQMTGTGITAAWSIQMAAVLSQATWSAVTCQNIYQHNLLTRPIELEEGYTPVPDQPGLGYELDRDTVERLRVTKPTSRPNPPRLVETKWPDGRTMYFANGSNTNFMLSAANAEIMPYYERGVTTRLVPNDGSSRWQQLHAEASQKPVLK